MTATREPLPHPELASPPPSPEQGRRLMAVGATLLVGLTAFAIVGLNRELAAEEAARAALAKTAATPETEKQAKTIEAELAKLQQTRKALDEARQALEQARLVAQQPATAAAPSGASHTPITLATDAAPLTLKAGQYTVQQLVEAWGKVVGRNVQTAAVIAKQSFTFKQTTTLTRSELRALLASRDVVLFVGAGTSAQVVSRRNLAHRIGSAILVKGNETVDPDRFVSRVVPVRHGGAGSIFATLRGVMTRDVNRVGNILYVQGPETITIIDLAHNVRRYEELLVQYDQPSQTTLTRVRVEVFRVSSAQWTGLRDKSRAKTIQALRDLSGEALLETVDLEVDPKRSIMRTGPATVTQLFKRTADKTTYQLNSDRSGPALRLSLQASTDDLSAELTASVPLNAKAHRGLTAKSLPDGGQVILVVTTD